MTASRFSRPLVALGSLVGLSLLFAGTDARANRYGDSLHAPLPILGTEGGPILSTAKIVPVYYSADPLASDLAAYFAKLATSRYLEKTVAQYGVTSLSIAPAIAVSDAPPTSIIDTDIASWLLAEIASGALPLPDSTTAYQVVYPATTVVNQGGLYGYTYQSCQEYVFDATDSTGTDIPFGVVPLCEGFVAGLTDIQSVTFESTANIANVVTNADVIDAPAYQDPLVERFRVGHLWRDLSLGSMCGISSPESSTTPEATSATSPPLASGRTPGRRRGAIRVRHTSSRSAGGSRTSTLRRTSRGERCCPASAWRRGSSCRSPAAR